MVRRMKSPKNKPVKADSPPSQPTPKINVKQQVDRNEAHNCLPGAFSLLSLHTDTTSASSLDMSFDFSSNGDDPSSSSNGDDPSTSSSSSELFWESDLIQMPLENGIKGFGGGGNKQKKVVASAGTVANVIGKGYVRHSPSGGRGKRYHSMKMKGLYNNKAANNEEAEQFLYSMLGDDCELSMAVVRDVLCQCGYEVEKALDVLLDFSATSSDQSSYGCHGEYRQNCPDSTNFGEYEESGDDEIAKFQLPGRASDSTFHLSEQEVQQILQSSGYGYRDYRQVLVGRRKQASPATSEPSLQHTVLESLFSIPKSSEHEPDSMNWKNVVKKMESIGQGLELRSDSAPELEQTIEYAKGEDYRVFRNSATQHYDAMKSCYQKAATAYSSGHRSYAAILSDQAKVHNKFAREADKKAGQEIFEARNKGIQNTITIDLHGQHVKQAMKLLKVHLLLFTTYVHSVQFLRVITGCGIHGHGVGKGKVKQSVIGLLKKEGITWSEENQGTLLIKLVGRRIFNFVESEDELE